MELHVFAAVLLAAALHAGWNAVVKTGLDRASAILLLALTQGGISLALLPFVPAPGIAAGGLVLFSGALHVGYQLFLVRAYTHGDLSQAYPLARGTAPPLVALVSVAFLGVALDGAELAAILLISVGVLTMALRGGGQGRLPGRALVYALGTAGFTAGYTLVDGAGARVAGTASGFILCSFAVNATGMAAIAFARRGVGAFRALRPAWRGGVAAGAMSLAAYWIAVWAFTQAPVALVAALRETSILFALLIGATLGEPVGRWRWLAAGGILAGLAATAL